MLEMPEDSFTWSRWRNHNLLIDMGISCRTPSIYKARKRLAQYFVGFVKSKQLKVRPKVGQYGAMFLYKAKMEWFHVTEKELNFILKENNNV